MKLLANSVSIQKDVKGMAKDVSEMDLVGVKMESTYFIVMAPHLYIMSNIWTGYSQKTIEELYSEWFLVAFPESYCILKEI